FKTDRNSDFPARVEQQSRRKPALLSWEYSSAIQRQREVATIHTWGLAGMGPDRTGRIQWRGGRNMGKAVARASKQMRRSAPSAGRDCIWRDFQPDLVDTGHWPRWAFFLYRVDI